MSEAILGQVSKRDFLMYLKLYNICNIQANIISTTQYFKNFINALSSSKILQILRHKPEHFYQQLSKICIYLY